MHLRAARQAAGADAALVGDGTTGAEVTEGATVAGGVLSTSAAPTEADGGATGAGGGSGNSSSLNVTAHFLDEDVEDYGFSEMQTVALACIATLIPLFFILVAAFAVRFVWRKFRGRQTEEGAGDAGGGGRGYDGVLQRDESSEAAKAAAAGGGTSATGSGGHLLLLMPDELKTSESQFSVTPGDDVTSQSPLISGASAKGPTASNHKGLGASKSANGNVITMTLQNNHLIVETEELASLPMVDDVEPSPPPASALPLEDTAQIHAPPPSADFRRAAPEEDLLDDEEGVGDLEGIAEEDEEEAEEEGAGRKEESEEEGATRGAEEEEEGGQAGLSQSDLSESSSIGSSNPTYRYGNQLGYAAGHFGYPQYAGYEAPRVTSVAPAEDEGGKDGGVWRGEAVNGEAGGEEEEDGEEEEERRHQRVQEQLGGAEVPSYAPGHHRTASLPKASDDIAALGMGGMPDADKIRCSKRRSLPIITHAPTTALGGFRKLLNEEEVGEEDEEAGRRTGDGKGSAEGGGTGELEVADKAAPQSRSGSDNAALTSGDVGTNSGEHENEAFVETD